MKKTVVLLLALMLICTSALAETGLTSFSTRDMQGETVTQDVFADYDLTMVNIWATWCGFCVQEMPELARLKDMLPENVNLITICDDASVEPELAAEILEASGATFQTLETSPEMYDQLLGEVYAFPTTCFLDSDGVLVGEPIPGVPSLENAADAYYTLIQSALAMLEG